jgi:hypothetical protein
VSDAVLTGRVGVEAGASITQLYGQVIKNIMPTYLVPVSGYFGTL